MHSNNVLHQFICSRQDPPQSVISITTIISIPFSPNRIVCMLDRGGIQLVTQSSEQVITNKFKLIPHECPLPFASSNCSHTIPHVLGLGLAQSLDQFHGSETRNLHKLFIPDRWDSCWGTTEADTDHSAHSAHAHTRPPMEAFADTPIEETAHMDLPGDSNPKQHDLRGWDLSTASVIQSRIKLPETYLGA